MSFSGTFSLVLTLAAIFPWETHAAEPVAFEIDGVKKRPILPYIYGTNQPDWQGHSKYLTLTRWGGNRITAYNWETNASNAGSDWQHQNDDYLAKSDFYLQQMRLAEQKARQRLLDVLDVHWYPEARGGNIRVSEDDARPEVAAARVQAPRSLWDPNYTEKSWITQFRPRSDPPAASAAREDREELPRHATGDHRVLLRGRRGYLGSTGPSGRAGDLRPRGGLRRGLVAHRPDR